MSLILCGLSWLGAAIAWVAAWAAIRECQIARRKLHRFRRGVIKDCYDAMDEVLAETFAEINAKADELRELQRREPSNN